MKVVNKENLTQKYFEEVWSDRHRLNAPDRYLLCGFHYGFFEKGIKNIYEAMYNMNNYIDKLLKLDGLKSGEILDIGCGVCSTSIFLAEKYPHINFTGLTLSSNEILYAKKFIKLEDVKNVRVLKRNYIKTEYQNDFFDGIFALESISYAPDKKELIEEIYRILKPGGRLVIIDGFRKKISNDSIIKMIYDFHCKNRGGADLPETNNFIKLLYKIGFEDIYINNISKNIRRHFIILFIDRFPYIISKFLKEMLKHRTKLIKNLKSYNRGIEIFDLFFGAMRICFYNSVTALKKL